MNVISIWIVFNIVLSVDFLVRCDGILVNVNVVASNRVLDPSSESTNSSEISKSYVISNFRNQLSKIDQAKEELDNAIAIHQDKKSKFDVPTLKQAFVIYEMSKTNLINANIAVDKTQKELANVMFLNIKEFVGKLSESYKISNILSQLRALEQKVVIYDTSNTNFENAKIAYEKSQKEALEKFVLCSQEIAAKLSKSYQLSKFDSDPVTALKQAIATHTTSRTNLINAQNAHDKTQKEMESIFILIIEEIVTKLDQN